MGPRLVSRGNAYARSYHQQKQVASMGPRLVRRGNETLMIAVIAPSLGFNGAATR